MVFNNVMSDNPPSDNHPPIQEINQHISQVDQAQQVSSTMRKEMNEFKEAILSSLPGVRLPVRKVRTGAITDTPFLGSITSVELPRKFGPPDMKLYDGSTDPDDHVIHYKYKMMSTCLDPHQWEAGMCRGFGGTLAGHALTWFINLPYRSIESYQQLADKFVEHFASSCKPEKTTNDLNAIRQQRGESLRSYVARFNKEKITIPDLHQPTAVEAFRNGLLSESGLYKKLTKIRCYTMDQAMTQAHIEIRWEEDKRNNKRGNSTNHDNDRCLNPPKRLNK